MSSDPKQGGDLFDMASQPDKVQMPNDAGKMNTIPSKPRPDQIASADDPNYLGGASMDQAATNAGDIPRASIPISFFPPTPPIASIWGVPQSRLLETWERHILTAALSLRLTCSQSTRDNATQDILTGTGDSLPSTVDSKRLHPVPGGMADDPLSKGHPRYEKHHVQGASDQELGASEGPGVEKAAGMEEMSDEQAMDSVERQS